MRARIEIHRNRAGHELALAFLAAAYVIGVLVLRPDHLFGVPFDRFAHFPLALGLSVWLPLLARANTSLLGDLRREGDDLVITGGRFPQRIPLRRVVGVRVAPGARGGSLAIQLDDGRVLAAALDDREDAEQLAAEIRRDSTAGDEISIRVNVLSWLAAILRPVTSLFALGYFLHVVPAVIPGDKALYGLGGLGTAAALLIVHVARFFAVRRLSAAAVASGPARAAGVSRAMHAHLALQGRSEQRAGSAPRPRVAEHGEPLGAWLARLRRELGNTEAYRGSREGSRLRLEQAYRSAEVPLRERAMALRVLAEGEAGEVRRRIAEAPELSGDERAWIEAVALEESDERALAKVATRPPDFVA